ncbi:hypothetical protein ACFWR9_40830 [Streptomyces sp. NPDC058534]
MITDESDAERSGLTGSPTILINRRDPFTGPSITIPRMPDIPHP